MIIVSLRENRCPFMDRMIQYIPMEEIMKRNIGNIERIVRIVAGLAIMSLAFIGPHSPWALLGIIPVATGFIGWCPPYALLGISTCGKLGSCEHKSCCS